jgi:polyisoprenoid-binding protein YceI
MMSPRRAPRSRVSIPFCSVVVIGCLAAPASAQQVIFAGSEITFTSRQMGVPVEGQFRKWNATVQFDLKKPEAGKLAFTIDMGSATLGAADTDAELAKPDWFNTAKFPHAQFQSSSIKATGRGRFEVSGPLTIKGSTLNITIPVTLAQFNTDAALRTTASGVFNIKRLAFKIGDGPWGDTSMVADDVQVKFKIQLSGVAPL